MSEVTRLSMSREEEEHSAIAWLVVVVVVEVVVEVAGGSAGESVGGTGFPVCPDVWFLLGILFLWYFRTGRKYAHEH